MANEARARRFERGVGFVGRHVRNDECATGPQTDGHHVHVRLEGELFCGAAVAWCDACGAPRLRAEDPCQGCAHLASGPGEVVRVGEAPA